jgi:hypothetical protein
MDGQVLSVGVHLIHGSEGTAALRLLFQKAAAGRVGESARS